jgi:hypothetical protein
MGNIPPKNSEKKVPRVSFAVISLVCGIFSLADGALWLGWLGLYPSVPLFSLIYHLNVYETAGAGLSVTLPLLAIIFAAIPLKRGKGTDWDGKDMAKVGLLTGIINLGWIIFCVSLYGIVGLYYPPPYMLLN